MKEPSLDDLAYFLAVADAGSLSAAAAATGASLPTLSRRMTALERDLGRKLFRRGPKGYALTADGRALADTVCDLRGVRAALDRWTGDSGPVRVRITAGYWTTRHLACHIDRLWSPDAGWVPEFLPSNTAVDLARRAADIGIRNAAPDQPWLARRRARRVDFAIYGTDGTAGFIALSDGVADTPSGRWLRQAHPDRILTTASDPRTCLDLARARIGSVILPTFIGDVEEELRRLSDPIDEISHDEWLVSHNDARHDPPVRAALDALAELLAA